MIAVPRALQHSESATARPLLKLSEFLPISGAGCRVSDTPIGQAHVWMRFCLSLRGPVDAVPICSPLA
jgi:hypothetical protein